MREVRAIADQLSPSSLGEEIGLLIKRLDREKSARQAAELAMEQKSQELFDANKEMRQLVTGSVALLTDVLAMARPEVFQKAGKVQRWAQRLEPHLNMARSWDLDLAATLYPLGMLSLPDELVEKAGTCGDVSNAEQEMIWESSWAAHNLLMHIPRMQPIARAILYCNKGFDGSGFPSDAVKGKDIPEAARVLKVLIDLADESTGIDRTRDFQRMAKNGHLYDRDVFRTAYKVLRRGRGQQDAEGEVMALAPGSLQPDDVVHGDIVDQEGRLLLAAGAKLSEIAIQRLRSLHKDKRIGGSIEVVRQ